MKKKILTTASMLMVAIALIVGSIAGTLAYLRSTAGVTNTFTYGSVAITMDETQIGPDGKKPLGDDAQRVVGNRYMLVPDTTYVKDPVIHVSAASSEMFLFLKVDNGIAGLGLTEAEQQAKVNALKAENPDISEEEIQELAKLRIHQQLLVNGWKVYNPNPADPTKAYEVTTNKQIGEVTLISTSTVYYLSIGAGADQTAARMLMGSNVNDREIKTFGYFTTSSTRAGEGIITAYCDNNANITVTAYAIQSSGDFINNDIHKAATIFASEWTSAIPTASTNP